MKRTILAPGHELLSYRIHEVTPYINWIYFFHAWGFQPRFAAIANIHGCDSCRALWLTTFPEEERTKASEAMQLFKEANRMLGRLDETISIHCIFRLCQANADGDNLLIEGTTFPLLRQPDTPTRWRSISLSERFCTSPLFRHARHRRTFRLHHQ